jgi:hypothetical protein
MGRRGGEVGRGREAGSWLAGVGFERTVGGKAYTGSGPLRGGFWKEAGMRRSREPGGAQLPSTVGAESQWLAGQGDRGKGAEGTNDW